MTRVALVIGCGSHSHGALCELPGAIRDAHRIYEVMTDASLGNYDPKASPLLISPTLLEVRTALQQTLFSSGQLDCFAFFFGGHGGVKAGSYYLCLRDTNPEQLSSTGLSISELFGNLNESQPVQSNIILDACQAGGLIIDLNQLLKPDLMGASRTPGISLFAASSSNEAAGEDDAGGISSCAFLRVLRWHKAPSYGPALP